MSLMMANAISTCPNLTRVKSCSCSSREKVSNRMNVQRVYFRFQCCDGRELNGFALSKTLGDCSKILFHGRSVSGFSSRGALIASFSAEQTQTITREAPTITHVPGKEMSPQLDDGDSGLPPPHDDGGGGGGGGGGGWSGGFFFFGFLAFLGLIRDKESEED